MVHMEQQRMARGNPSRCVLCDVNITAANDSREHIIQNAIGGRRKVSGFTCRQCNNTSGASDERELARQFGGLAVLLGIKRERGDPPPITVQNDEGAAFEMHHDGTLQKPKPDVGIERLEDSVRINVTARTEDEAKEILQGIARKYPKLDVDAALRGANRTSTTPGQVTLPSPQGDLGVGRSMVKCGLALIASAGADPRAADIALRFLRNPDADACFGYYYTKDPVVNRNTGQPLHCVHVQASKKSGVALAYVEYFGCFRVMVHLSSDWSGPDLKATYAIDPRTGEAIEAQVQLELDESEVAATNSWSGYDASAFKKAFAGILGPAMGRWNGQDKAIEDAVRYAFENCGAQEGDILTDEQFDKMRRLVIERLEPYILSRIRTNHESDAV